jgi:hypothetical protein
MTVNPGDADGGTLFEYTPAPSAALNDRFGVPPFSVWDKRSGDWQRRKRRWLALGIESELGRDQGLTFGASSGFMRDQMENMGTTTSVFDPVVCELAYRWFSNVGDAVLDPFAGGSVRGIVAGVLERDYTGIDLRREQVLANRMQADLVPGPHQPAWVVGDATRAVDVIDRGDWASRFDMILTCPPYADLEQYSDDPADLSNMTWPEFLKAYRASIYNAAELLLDDRFAVWVISDVRSKQTGLYRGLVAESIEAFQDNGLDLYNDIILVEPVGTARLRGANLFNKTRKVSRTHQHVLVFVKGDPGRAAKRLAPVDPRLLEEVTEGE